MPTYKAIPTKYKGIKFRSRLEAKWAIFFDEMDIIWEYEPEGFVLSDNICYLPDFYLPELNLWIEVKGVLSEIDDEKIFNFEEKDKIGQIVMVGEIPPECDDVVEWVYHHYKKWDAYRNDFLDFPYVPCVCPICGKFGFEFDGRGSRICRHDDDDKGYTANNPKILAAYEAARLARFEHGERPATESK